MQHLNRAVIHRGRAYPSGTARDAAPGVPDGPWWGGDASALDAPAEPPRAGKGSGVEAWRQYAAAIGVEHDDDASRDDIIAAVDAAS